MAILVWGASPESVNVPLFPTIGAPSAAAFRELLRARLIAESNGKMPVYFSEEWDEHGGHHPANAGFYEPLHLENCRAVVLVFPGDPVRPMGVNTWETALALERNPSQAASMPHFGKCVFVVPGILVRYLLSVYKAKKHDPKDFPWPGGSESEPVLGAAGSFAARWIYLAAMQDPLLAPHSRTDLFENYFVEYPDGAAWDLMGATGTSVATEVVEKVSRIAEL